RRLCYVGMTRAMDRLILSRAVYRRRYGTDLPEASVPSRFLEEVPAELLEDVGSPRKSRGSFVSGTRASEREAPASTHYAYEDEDQSVSWAGRRKQRAPASSYGGQTYNSIENIAEFFASRGNKFNRPKVPVKERYGKKGLRKGQKVRQQNYGEGTVWQ